MVTLYRNVFEEAGLQDMGLKYNSAGTLAAADNASIRGPTGSGADAAVLRDLSLSGGTTRRGLRGSGSNNDVTMAQMCMRENNPAGHRR